MSLEEKRKKLHKGIRKIFENQNYLKGLNAYKDYMFVRMFGAKKLKVGKVEVEYSCIPPDSPIRVHLLLVSHNISMNLDTLDLIKKELNADVEVYEGAKKVVVLRCRDGIVNINEAFDRRLIIDNVTINAERLIKKLIRTLLKHGWLKKNRLMEFNKSINEVYKLEKIASEHGFLIS